MVYSLLKYLPRSTCRLPQGLVRKYSTKPAIEKKKYGAIVTRAISESPSKPLLVILGWNDCKIKHLEKYRGLFETRDWPTVCLPTKSINTFLRSGTKTKTISFYMLDLIKELTVKGNPVLFYSFSAGGCTVYFHIAKALTTPGQQNFDVFKIVGSIFDSCPTRPSMEGIPRAKISVTEGINNPILRYLAYHALGFAIPFVVRGNTSMMKRYFEDLGKMPLRSPELYLYSKADKLSLHEDITEHINYRRSQGVEVFTKVWEDSPHVRHYIKYPEEYTDMVDNFLDVCFEKNN